MTTHRPLDSAPALALAFGVGYAVALHGLERRYPITPDHTWAEVAGGILGTLAAVSITARMQDHAGSSLTWRDHEQAVYACFVASGAPVIAWQLALAVVRQSQRGIR